MDCFYYTNDNAIFASKIQALAYSQKTQQPLYFNYYDAVYEKYDWTTEPAKPIDYYYKEQAQRIRDNYDHVILCYSGGYDSTNILETFYYNNIKLDKIVIVGAFSQDSQSGVDQNHNGELYHNAFPYLTELGLESITQVCDYTKLFDNVDNFSVSAYGENWVDTMGSWYSPHNWFWKDLEKHILPSEWHGKKVAVIMGRDKPSLFCSPDSPPIGSSDRTIKLNSFCFRDTPVTSYGGMNKFETIKVVNFYWDPYFPEIMIKQLHLLYNVYQQTSTVAYNSDLGVVNYGKFNTNEIIYNLKKPIIFKSPKSKTHLLSLKDSYLINKKNSDIHDLYNAGINYLKNKTGLDSLPVIQSKHYKITK